LLQQKQLEQAMEAEQITQALRQFTGTTQYTRYHSNLLLTDGIVVTYRTI
jgi:hypothetical protein